MPAIDTASGKIDNRGGAIDFSRPWRERFPVPCRAANCVVGLCRARKNDDVATSRDQSPGEMMPTKPLPPAMTMRVFIFGGLTSQACEHVSRHSRVAHSSRVQLPVLLVFGVSPKQSLIQVRDGERRSPSFETSALPGYAPTLSGANKGATTPENSLCSPVIPLYVSRSPHQGVMNFVTLLRRVFCRPYPDPTGGFYCNEHAHY